MLSVILSRSTGVSFIESTSNRVAPDGSCMHTSHSASSRWHHGSGDQIDSPLNRPPLQHGIAVRGVSPTLEPLPQTHPADACLPRKSFAIYPFGASALASYLPYPFSACSASVGLQCK